MQIEAGDAPLTDIADGTFTGAEWEGWLEAHHEEAAEIEIARCVRSSRGTSKGRWNT